MKKTLLFLLFFYSYLHAQVPNDDCATGTFIPVNPELACVQSVSGTLTGATASSQFNTCTGAADDDVWFFFNATHNKHRLSITTVPQLPEGLKAILYTGPCTNSVPPRCINFTNGMAELNNIIPGQTYHIRVYSVSNVPQSVSLSVCVTTLPAIIIDTNYTAQQIVQDVLIDNPCVQVSNITASGGSSYNQPHSMAVFEHGNSNFPFERGIILSTGPAAMAVGPNITTDVGTESQNNPGWPGDYDLQLIMGGNPQPAQLNYHDATVLEFDFVPMIDNISFDFLFASEEYGQFQCNFSDAFAFILTDVATGNKTNLAVVPGTTIPVSVTSIRNNTHNTQCTSANPDFFGHFYASGDINSPVNFNGVTVPLTAQSAVVPGQQYHIKLVIANFMDHIVRSAVFIDAGSFNIGGLDEQYVTLTSSAGNMLCEGAATILSVNANTSFNFAWFRDGLVIAGANQNTLTVTEPGTYTVHVTIPGSSVCGVQYTMEIFNAGAQDEIEVADYWLYIAQTTGTETFDLNLKAQEITAMSGGEELYVTFYLTPQDAQDAINPLPVLFTNTENPQTIYARAENFETGCFATTSFRIGAVDENYIAPIPAGSIDQPFVQGQTLADLEVEGEDIQWYDAPGVSTGRTLQMLDSDIPLPLSTLLVDGETYYASQTLFGRESQDRLAVTVHLMLGTADDNFSKAALYPNPVIDVLTISNTQVIEKFEVYNIMGQLIRRSENNSNIASVNMTDMQSGAYFVKVYSGQQMQAFNVWKK